MIRSYFKLALRHLQRDKGYAAIHLIGLALGAPVAYLATEQWLVDFAYRVALSLELFLGTGLLLLIVALLTAGGQALRAAFMDPVAALCSE